MSERILLTGASGFVGHHVLGYLLEHGDAEIVCVCSFRHKGRPSRIADHPAYREHAKRVDVVTHDLTAPLSDLGRFDTILHLASESHVDRSIQTPAPFVLNNIASTLTVLEHARLTGSGRFVLFSTDEVWGDAGEGPSNPYAASKAAQENVALAYQRTYGVALTITNSNNIIGTGQDPEKFVPKVLRQVSNGEEVAIHAHHGEIGSRVWNPVANVCDALGFILDRDLTGQYALSGGEELSNLEMAQRLAEVLGKPLRYKIVEVGTIRPGYDRSYAVVGQRLEQYGWTRAVNVDRALQGLV